MPPSDNSTSRRHHLHHRLAATCPHTMHAADHGHVHVHLHVPLKISHRDQADRACAASATAQKSLRRFAQGYVFGTASKIGSSATNITNSNSDDTSLYNQQQFATVSGPRFDECKGDAFQTQKLSTTNNSIRNTDSSSSATPTRFNTTPTISNRCANTQLFHPSHSIQGSSESTPKRTRSSLVFGENAPKTSLSIKDRLIGRRTVPKRLREHVTVDGLSVMMEKLLGKPIHDVKDKAQVKRMKASKNDDSIFARLGKVTLTSENKTRNICKNHQQLEIPLHTSTEETSTPIQRETQVIADDKDDDGTADELSFLVNQCELNPEKQDHRFMPYIT